MESNELLKRYAEETAEAWVQDFIRARVAYLRKKFVKASGNLERSMQYEINSRAVKEAVTLLLAFEDYGRIIDMRRIAQHDPGRDMIEEIKAWVRDKGVGAFMRGYKRRRKYIPQNNERLLSSIAWGIAKQRAQGKRRRKRWYNKQKSGALTDLLNKLAAGLPDTVGPDLVKQFPNKI